MKYPIKVLIPVFSKSIKGKIFSVSAQNPGVGGTQFVSIQLALYLANYFSFIQVQLVSDHDIQIREKPSNLVICKTQDINTFFHELDLHTNRFVVISPASVLKYVHFSLLRRHRRNIVAWMHHPFMLDLRLFNLIAHVHVGTYQYFSNSLFYKHNWHINNIFSLPGDFSIRSAPQHGSKLRLVCLGSLVRGKGFVHVARQWPSIKYHFPGAELHVIGSAETYGLPIEHPIIPCANDLANEILESIPIDDIKSGAVVFHGNLGEEKFKILRSSHFALLNPTGATEAFPASPLECMACGLPVIASDDYGMSDSMRYFPELILSCPEDIPYRIKALFNDKYAYEEVSARCIAVAAWYDSQKELILLRWMRLIQKVASESQCDSNGFYPMMPLYGSIFKLRWRQARSVLGAFKRLLVSFASSLI